MSRARRFALLFACELAACGFAACGEAPQGGAPTGLAWKRTALEGLGGATTAAHHEGWLFAAAGDERRVFAVRTADLVDGRRAAVRPVPLEVAGERTLEGHARGADDLAAQGYTLGHLWGQPLSFGGLCLRRVVAGAAGRDEERLHLLDRTHGVVFWGRLERDEAGLPARVHLEHAFVTPGRERAGAARLDWRDTGAGLAGLLAPRGAEGAEDLLLVERGREGETQVVVRRLDRFGQPRGVLRVGLPAEHRRPVSACGEARAGRLVLLLDGPDPLLVVAAASARGDSVSAEGGLRAPPAPPGAVWRGLAYAADGSEFLVSDGPQALVAWR
jgi:hypothetical protein